MGLFKKSYVPVTLHLNARLQPMHRDEYYETPLGELIKKSKLGRVDGGGTLLSQEGEPLNCDVEIDCVKGKEEELYAHLKNLPLPKGSSFLICDTEKRYPLGTLEGMGIYLNGSELPKEVYKECDVNVVVEELCKALDKKVFLYSYWEGPHETALYFYGDNFDEMKESAMPFLQSYPLCEKCRIVNLTE